MSAITVCTYGAQIVVGGCTYPIKEELKKRGFRWNWRGKYWYIHVSSAYATAEMEEIEKFLVELALKHGLRIYLDGVTPTWISQDQYT